LALITTKVCTSPSLTKPASPGNFWNIYNLPQHFDKTEQPELNYDEFLECVQTAFATQSRLAQSAAIYEYMDRKCEHGPARSQFYAEQVNSRYPDELFALVVQVNQMVGDYFFTCDSLWLADQMQNHPGHVYIYYFDQPSRSHTRI
jgi:hypothetical protein